jgi:hypothetical protein
MTLGLAKKTNAKLAKALATRKNGRRSLSLHAARDEMTPAKNRKPEAISTIALPANSSIAAPFPWYLMMLVSLLTMAHRNKFTARYIKQKNIGFRSFLRDIFVIFCLSSVKS